jgi:hypothetical protein
MEQLDLDLLVDSSFSRARLLCDCLSALPFNLKSKFQPSKYELVVGH